MARVAFALELGGELGHVRGCRALGESLALRGHHIAYLVSQLHSAKALGGAAGDVLLVQAGTSATRPQQPASYAEILVGCGYEDATQLAAIADPWRAHFETWKPDLVVADFAPTAMLAARTLGIRRVNLGTSFTVPPRLTPLPSFRFNADVPPERLATADARALASVNNVLQRWGEAPLARLADLLACDEEMLCGFPELDAYGERPASGYWGPRFETTTGARAAWPAGTGKRVFAYLKPSLPQLDALIDALAASRLRLIAFIPGLDEARRARLAGAARLVSKDPVRLEPLLGDCDLALTAGGGLSAGMAANGIPQVVFPAQYEQFLMARRIEQIGAGLTVTPNAAPEQAVAAVSAVASDARFRAAAQSFKRRYPAYSPQEQRRRMVLRLEALARGRAGDAPILAASNNKEPTP